MQFPFANLKPKVRSWPQVAMAGHVLNVQLRVDEAKLKAQRDNGNELRDWT
jgi:hypothetical protein